MDLGHASWSSINILSFLKEVRFYSLSLQTVRHLEEAGHLGWGRRMKKVKSTLQQKCGRFYLFREREGLVVTQIRVVTCKL